MRNLMMITLLGLLGLTACKTEKKEADNSALQNEVQAYLDSYNAEYQKLVTASSEGQWTMQTHIVK